MSGLIEQVRLARRLPAPAIAKAIRQAAGVSQSAVADELAVHRVTVARWESGDRRPQGDLLRRYVELLDALDSTTRDGDRAAS